jgi:molecular chaperone Hsp33
VTADAAGRVKGYVNHPQVLLPINSRGKLDVGGALGSGTLSVIRDMGLKEPYVGQTALQTGEIAEDLTYYFANSEQIPSSVGLGVLMDKKNTVAQAGGFILQLMPFAEEKVIAALEEKLAGMTSVTAYLEQGRTPKELLEGILGEMNLEITETTEAAYFCNCSRQRVEKALISLGEKELKDMIAEGEPVQLHCHFCGEDYSFSIDELKEIVKGVEHRWSMDS